MQRMILIFLLFLSYTSSIAQSAEWWIQNVQWDGVSHWSKYITYTSAHLGPNALPVPKLSNGNIDSMNSISVSAMYQSMKGDQTTNLAVYGNYCIVKDRISVDAFWVPVEYFNVSHALKEQRKIFYYVYDVKKAMGDIHLNLNINLLNKIRDKVQLSLRTGFRYATSSEPAAARMTDAPGYYFDISAAKPFSKQSSFKLVMMAGFLAWQRLPSGQDDAFLFGTGIEYNKKQFQLQTHIAGFIGYLKNGDQPVVYRLRAGSNKKGMNWFAQFQQGLHDFKYTTGEMGGRFVF
ncbi:MAG: hypothetical protein K2X48_03395 [Chitinophagaceae bacterium]|nr:hypothetical protein [Chitinophagaceae bacterium]